MLAMLTMLGRADIVPHFVNKYMHCYAVSQKAAQTGPEQHSVLHAKAWLGPAKGYTTNRKTGHAGLQPQ